MPAVPPPVSHTSVVINNYRQFIVQFRQLGNNIIMTQSYFLNFRIFFSQHSRLFRQLGNNIIMTQSYFFNFRIFFPNIHVFYVQLRQFDILMADAVPDSAKKVHYRLMAVGTVGAQSVQTCLKVGVCPLRMFLRRLPSRILDYHRGHDGSILAKCSDETPE